MTAVLRWAELSASGQEYDIRRSRFVPGRGIDVHGHDFAELFWIRNGRGNHLVNGRRQALGRGDLVFIRPDDFHGFSAPGGESFELANLAFPAHVLNALRRTYFPTDHRWFWTRDREPEVLRLTNGRLSELDRQAGALGRGIPTAARRDAFLLGLLGNGVEDGNSFAAEPGLPSWLARACREIRRSGNLAGGVGRFCELAGRSPEHVSRSVRKHLGTTPSRLVEDARQEFATYLLRMTDLSVLEVGYECGYGNAGHFHARFKARHGTSPRRYRVAFLERRTPDV